MWIVVFWILVGYLLVGVCWCVMSVVVCIGVWDVIFLLLSIFVIVFGFLCCCRWCICLLVMGLILFGSIFCWILYKCRVVGVKLIFKIKFILLS